MTEIAVFGGGCFWCTEAIFNMMKGVVDVRPGYAGGPASGSGPTYEEVCTGTTGHAEVIRIEYDPNLVPYEDLLKVFFGSHDPTTLNRQGNDVGTQYRSVIFYTTPSQKEIAESKINEINQSAKLGQPIVTEVSPLDQFYEAEDYHQKYFENHQNNGYCQVVINLKLEKVQKEFADLLKDIN